MLIIKKKDWYSAGVLFLLLFGEFFAVWGGVHNHCDNWMWLVIIAAVSLFLLLVSGFCNGTFKFEFPAFTNLLASAITPRPVSVLYLLGFVMHLSWLTDGVLNYFVGDSWQIPFFIGLVGIVVLWIAFPGVMNKNNDKKVVFVSGISMIAKNDPVKIRYNGKEETANSLKIFNFQPLVRMLNLVFLTGEIKPEKVGKFLILNSKINTMDKLLVILEKKDKNGNQEKKDETRRADSIIIDVTAFVKGNEELKNNLKAICDVRDVNEGTMSVIYLDHKDDIHGILRTFIKVTALIEYPKQVDFIKNLTIDFTQECDYDEFYECFKALRTAVEKEDRKEQVLYFNITPGTGIVGSLMTLFSIDNDRYLYYHAQSQPNERIKAVDKTVIPLENLLSQALQKMKMK